jgi:hypothetical protein
MSDVFLSCDIKGYISGVTKWPNENLNPEGVYNWDKNDIWAQQVIMNNVTSLQMNHIRSKCTAKAMYILSSIWHPR